MGYKTKLCIRCGSEYQPNSGHQKYCSECGPVVHRIRTAKCCKANPEKVKASRARWEKANPEKIRARVAKYQKTHPEKRAVIKSKRRAQYSNTPLDEMLTSTEWLAILVQADGHCAYCDKEAKLTLDHVIPLSKGGKHSKDNIVAACGHCNSSKKDKTLQEWMTWRELDTQKISV